MEIDEVMESPAFWLLGGGGCIAVLIGWIASKNMGMDALPLWQLVVVLITVVIVSAFFATRN